ncbi:MAG: gliding motility-associated C-terminal domain-containing protein, partial [Ferruginibacter sp.]
DIGLAGPLYDNIIIPRNSTAGIVIKNPGPGNYSLSANPAGTPILQQNATGNFTVSNISSDTAFFIKNVSGNCSSVLVRVNIKVVDVSYFAIPKAFTPNNDKTNDVLSVRAIGYIQLKSFKIYNRYGEVVFETKQLNDSWNGKFKGILQPTGAFMWIAEGTDLNGIIVKDKGSIILIR